MRVTMITENHDTMACGYGVDFSLEFIFLDLLNVWYKY